MARRYAADTSVSVAKSRAEIEQTLDRYGASSVMMGRSDTEAVIAFEMRERRVMFRLALPNPNSEEFSRTPSRNKLRSSDQRQAAWEQACRSRWRALLLAIKAKLEAVEVGITTFEDEFMAHIVMPDGRTVSDHVAPKIESAYKSGEMQPLLPAPST